jgi:hypothetical protein
MASIKTSIKQKARNNATFKLTEEYNLDGSQPLIAMKNFLNVKLQSQTKKRGKANYTSQVRQTLELGSC